MSTSKVKFFIIQLAFGICLKSNAQQKIGGFIFDLNAGATIQTGMRATGQNRSIIGYAADVSIRKLMPSGLAFGASFQRKESLINTNLLFQKTLNNYYGVADMQGIYNAKSAPLVLYGYNFSAAYLQTYRGFVLQMTLNAGLGLGALKYRAGYFVPDSGQGSIVLMTQGTRYEYSTNIDPYINVLPQLAIKKHLYAIANADLFLNVQVDYVMQTLNIRLKKVSDRNELGTIAPSSKEIESYTDKINVLTINAGLTLMLKNKPRSVETTN